MMRDPQGERLQEYMAIARRLAQRTGLGRLCVDAASMGREDYAAELSIEAWRAQQTFLTRYQTISASEEKAYVVRSLWNRLVSLQRTSRVEFRWALAINEASQHRDTAYEEDGRYEAREALQVLRAESTDLQWSVLSAVAEAGPWSGVKVAQSLGVSRGAVTTIRHEARALVEG